MKKISIFGCGWVGSALANHLQQYYHDNLFLQVSVQSVESYEKLAFPNSYILNQSNSYHDSSFYECDILIIAIPPRNDYIKTLKKVLSYIDKSKQLIVLSSTSVYTQESGFVTENDTNSITNPNVMLQAEKILQTLYPDVLILRLGGLMGYDRVAGKSYFKRHGREKLKSDSYVNYVHREDVVFVITQCIENRVVQRVYNVVAPNHSSKKEIYIKNAQQFGFEPILFESNKISGKRVKSQKLIAELNYTFLKENPLEFWS